MRIKKCFTLAEVLITLAIIGVVAALTIPTLITKMSQKTTEARTKTIEARLLDGINRYSTLEDGLSQSYETTYDFLVGLSKHYKMAQICKADEITNCVPYSTINYTQDGEDKSVEVSTLTSIGSFISGDAANDYLAPASFITGQGTPVVMAFKKDCVWDTGKAMRDITDSGCIAYMYDENGTRNPNKIGKDWVGHGLSIIPPSAEAVPIATINGVKIMEKAFFTDGNKYLTKAQCEAEEQKDYGVTMCDGETDYWAYAMKYCHDKGWHLPDEEEGQNIAMGLFYNINTHEHDLTSNNNYGDNYKIDTEIASDKLGLKSVDGSDLNSVIDNYTIAIYSQIAVDAHNMKLQYVFRTMSPFGSNSRIANVNRQAQVLCVGD